MEKSYKVIVLLLIFFLSEESFDGPVPSEAGQL